MTARCPGRCRATMPALVAAAVMAMAMPALAQAPEGHVSLQAVVLPSVAGDTGQERRVSELRARVFVDKHWDVGDRLRLTAALFAEGLVADRTGGATSRAGILRPQELHAEMTWSRVDLRVGYTRLAWGTLDEFLPTDVVNPLDVSRFFLEGRTEGRLPVGLARLRWFPRDGVVLEGVVVPVFRRGRFDELEEETSPFYLAPTAVCPGAAGACLPVSIASEEPSRKPGHAQGGGRLRVTSGRVDWSVSAYRGFEALPVYEHARVTPATPATPATPVTPAPTSAVPVMPVTNAVPGITLDARYPRFTMIGADMETVSGPWGLRAEAAAFPQRRLQVPEAPVAVDGRLVEAGAGVDRQAGAYRLSGDVIVTRQWAADGNPAVDRTDVTVVAAAERGFARDTRRLRVLGVYDPSDGTAFARAIAEASLRDNLSLEVSAGLFAGDGVGRLGRLASLDFATLRLKVFY